jgi:hypothetical protein
MELNRQAFLDGWESAKPLLQRDALLRDLTEEWGMTLPNILSTLEETLARVTTIEALFERLEHKPAVAVVPYAAMLVLRTLLDLSAQPVTAIIEDLTIGPNEAMVIYGNATVSGSVQNNGALIVFGDLAIENLYADAAWSYSFLTVGGSVRARGVLTYGDILIRGDLQVSDITHAWYNDYTLAVGGALQTKVLLEEHHETRYTTLDAQDTAPLYGDSARLREIFAADLFRETERNGEIEVEFDIDDLFDRLEHEQAIYRT